MFSDRHLQGQAAFLGSLTGGLIGLVALLLGALFNTHLNRRRDHRRPSTLIAGL